MRRGTLRRPTVHFVAAASVAIALSLHAAPGSPGSEAARPPDFDGREHRSGYEGPGREAPEPAGMSEIPIAWFGPADPGHPVGGDPWIAAGIAIDRINREGGVRGLPLRLVPVWSEDPWGTGIAGLARLAYTEPVPLLLGSIDGASTHLAEQVVAKARLPLIDPGSRDSSVNTANVPWIFSCLPGDDGEADLLAGVLSSMGREAQVTLVSATDHDSRHAADQLLRSMARLGAGPSRHLEVPHDLPPSPALAKGIAAASPDAVVILAGPTAAADLVRRLRDHRPGLSILGGASLGRRAFLEAAGDRADGILIPRSCDTGAFPEPFRREFLRRAGGEPDCAAAQAYDAVRLAAETIRAAGWNRARIRDHLEALEGWEGVAGPLEWGPLGRNERALGLGRIEGGRVVEGPASARAAAQGLR